MSEVLNYADERVLFDRPLSHNQAVQLRVADMARRITTAQVLALQLGRLKDAGKLSPTQVSIAKWNNCRMALDIARDARDLLGGAGISAEYVSIRHMLNLESVITYEGTETIHQLVVGKELTGVNDTLFFSAGVNGRELWKSDGTSEGTLLVKDINPDSESSSLWRLTNVNGTLFFWSYDGANGWGPKFHY